MYICNFIKKESLAQVFLLNFANFVRTPFLQNTTGRLLLIIAVSKETVYYDTKTKAYVPM